MCKFQKIFPQIQIVASLSQQLRWSHFVEIILLSTALERNSMHRSQALFRYNCQIQRCAGFGDFSSTWTHQFRNNRNVPGRIWKWRFGWLQWKNNQTVIQPLFKIQFWQQSGGSIPPEVLAENQHPKPSSNCLAFLLCARHGARLAGGSPVNARVRGRTSRAARRVSWGTGWRKPKANHWPDEQKSHKRPIAWVRRQSSSKPKTYTESQYVDAAGISVKDVRLTLGGLQRLEESAEAIVPSQTVVEVEPCCLQRRMRG